LAPSDRHLFGLLKNHLGGNCFSDDEEVEMEVWKWLKQRSKEILGFRTLSIVRIFLNTNEKTQRFRNWICFHPQVREDTYSVGSLRKS
jgi:hypothetical protein